ncbi:MAG TPA: hypothetical protein PLV83_03780, partial [Bacilli bacterium]|nr:hypothetical protein [Bacilli bacterium]
MKKFLIGFISFFILISSTNALEVNSQRAVLYNLNDNTIVYEKNKDEITSIASLTKIMTTLVAIENIKELDNNVTITNDMLKGLKEANASVAGLKLNQKVTYRDLLYGTFLASGADAARGLALSISGSEDKFVELMNKKAKDLGLAKTVFTNTTGLDYKTQSSTVDEVAKLLKTSLENKTFKEIFYAKSYTFSDKSITVYSTLYKTATYYKLNADNILGGKTGYTTNAGRCLASVAYDSVNDITYLLVTTNAPINNGEHVKDAVRIYEYYFENYKYHNLVDKNDLLVTLNTKYVKEKEISFKAKEDVKAYLDNTFDKKDVKLTYKGLDIINAGLKKGDVVGKITVSYKDKDYKTIDVVLDNDVKFSIIEFIKVNIMVISIALVVII